VVYRLAFRFLAVVLLAFCSLPVLAQEFSADMVRLKPPGTVTSKVYVRGDKMRFEATGQQQHSSVAIIDLATRTSLMILADNKTYVKSPPGRMSASIPFFLVTDPEHACSAWEKSVDQPGTCTKVGEESINGRSTVKYKGTAGNGDNGYVWVDRNLKFVVKWEGEKTAAELQNIQEGAQASSLFMVPAGYEMFDLAAAQQGAKAKGKTKTLPSQQKKRAPVQ
jgi:hypothetical protein